MRVLAALAREFLLFETLSIVCLQCRSLRQVLSVPLELVAKPLDVADGSTLRFLMLSTRLGQWHPRIFLSRLLLFGSCFS